MSHCTACHRPLVEPHTCVPLEERIAERPAHACLLCPPPKNLAWWPADPGYRTCSDCYDKIRFQLREVERRWLLLDPRPGGQGETGGRGAPGFGSRAPASDHIIAMRDRRSSPVAHVWVGRDGRVHQETEKPPLSVHGVLEILAWDVAEQRGQDGPAAAWDVHQLVRYLDVNLDWSTRQASVVELSESLRGIVAQLRPVTGDPSRKRVGACPNVDLVTQALCAAPLFAPAEGDTIRCGRCGYTWERPDWEHLGKALQEQRVMDVRQSA